MITLCYANNVQRANVGEISIEALKQAENAEKYILEAYQKAGCAKADDPHRLYVKRGNGDLEPLCQAALEDNETILYSAVVAPENALEYAKEDGITYIFHTAEQGHRANPHIHARFGGDEISIYFSDLHVVGNMKSKKKRRQAVKYVEANLADMLEFWNRIMLGQE